MAVDTRKLKDDANALYLKGKIKDAIKLLETVVKTDKRDVKSMVKLGDCFRKVNDKNNAIASYKQAARLYAAQGFLVNAISVSKMILSLDPNEKEIQEMLAGLYAKRERETGGGDTAAGVKGASLDILEQFRKKPAAATPAGAPAEAPAPAAAPSAPAPAAVEAAPVAETDDEIILGADDDLDVDGEDILSQIPSIPLFSHLTRDEFIHIIDQLQLLVYEPNDLIICEGDHGDSFFVITRGTAVVTKKDPSGQEVEVAELSEGNFFGEFAFLADSDRRASVMARTELEVLEFSRDKLDAMIARYPRVREVMLEFYRERVMKTLLAISPLFQPFQEHEKQELAGRFEHTEVPKGTVVIQEGTEGDGLYLIMSGSVRVTKNIDGKEVELATLNDGEFFGEMSLLLRQKTTATVAALSSASFFKLPKAVFNELILTHPQILEVVSEFTDKRKASTQRVLAGSGALAGAGMV